MRNELRRLEAKRVSREEHEEDGSLFSVISMDS